VLFLYGLSGTIQIAPLIASLGTLAVFVLFERFLTKNPIIPLTVLHSRGALLSCVAQLGFMAARWTVLFYTPITALAVRGFSPAASGSILIPTNLGFGLGGLLVGGLREYLSPCYCTRLESSHLCKATPQPYSVSERARLEQTSKIPLEEKTIRFETKPG
jgi:hypothetical protein